MEFYKTASKYLQTCGTQFSDKFLRSRMQSHPDYPSLVSFTDTMDEMNLSYSAVIADKENFDQLEFPLLAYIERKREKDFLIVNSPFELVQNDKALLTAWSGIAVILKKDSQPNFDEQKELFVKEKKESKRIYISFTLLAFLLLSTLITPFNGTGLMLMILSIAGMGICSLIMLHKMGSSNTLTEKFCSGDGNNGCDKVLKSSDATERNTLTLGDVGFIYFMGLTLFLALSSLTNSLDNALSLLQIPVFLGLPAASFSVWYQWKILKSWCKLCLACMSVLVIQAVLLFLVYTSKNVNLAFTSQSILLLMASFIISAIAEQNILSLVRTTIETVAIDISLLKWKRDPAVFLSLLYSQRKVKIDPWEGDIIIGNPEAPLQLMVACNPYCNPCAEAHKHLEKLSAMHPDNIGITIRFGLGSEITGKKGKAVAHILHAYHTLKRNGNSNCGAAVDDWFDKMNLQDYIDKYGVIPLDESYISLLSRHNNWTSESKISQTPTIFINGYQLPNNYRIPDLKLLVNQVNDNMILSKVEKVL